MQPKTSRREPARACITELESLEARYLMSNSPFAVLKHGALAVHGTSSDDGISVSTEGPTDAHGLRLVIQVNAVSFSYSAKAVRTLHVYGDAGDDSMELFSLNDAHLRGVTLYGGDGIDNITLDQIGRPSFRIVAHGGAGHDLIENDGYASALCGDAGDDWIIGDDSGEVISGGDGNDTLRGNRAGNVQPGGVTLRGGAGNDELLLQTSTLEHVFSGAASPYGPAAFTDSVLLNGGPGDDIIIGHAGATGGEGSVTLAGGTGADQFYPFANEVISDLSAGDMIAGNDFFEVPPPAVVQNATLSVTVVTVDSGNHATTTPLTILAGIGNHAPTSSIETTDGSGTLLMRGPAGDTFTLNEFFNNAGFPLRLLGPFESGFNTTLDLNVNGVDLGDALTYAIQPGDRLSLTITENALG